MDGATRSPRAMVKGARADTPRGVDTTSAPSASPESVIRIRLNVALSFLRAFVRGFRAVGRPPDTPLRPIDRQTKLPPCTARVRRRGSSSAR